MFRVLGIYNFALLLVFHQDSFQKRAGAEATPRDTSHYHQSYNYSVKYLGKITIVFIHIFKINFLTFFLITSVAIVPASVHSYSICKKKYKMKIYSMQYIVNSTEQNKLNSILGTTEVKKTKI